MSATPPPTPDEPAGPTNRRRWLLWGVVGVIALVGLVYGAIFFYANVINDSPDALDETDLSEAVAGTDTSDAGNTATSDPAASTATTSPADDPASTEAPASGEATESTERTESTESTEAPASGGATFDGTWAPTDASEFGYRVEEVLAGVNTTAVGRSNEIEGALTVEGTSAEVDVVVQVASITSDDSRRDGQFRGRIMDAESFPTASFRTTEPIELGTVPGAGEQVTATATGELTLKGSTQPVTFEVTAEATPDRIGVLGSIPVRFEDYGIDNPSFGAVTTEDNGLVEFVLVFERP